MGWRRGGGRGGGREEKVVGKKGVTVGGRSRKGEKKKNKCRTDWGGGWKGREDEWGEWRKRKSWKSGED